MGKIRDFFTNKSKTTTEDNSVLATPQSTLSEQTTPYTNTFNLASPLDTISTNEPTIFHPRLASMAKVLMPIQLTHTIGVKLDEFSHSPILNKAQIEPLFPELATYIESYQTALAQLKDSNELVHDYIIQCQELTRSSTALPLPTYENFLTYEGVELIKKDLLILSNLQKLLPILFTESSGLKLSEVFRQHASALAKVNTLSTTLQNFNIVEENLRNDIEAFSKAVIQLQSNKSLSVDWNGQKAAFLKLKQELEERREHFLKDETTLNTAVQKIHEEFVTLHNQFQLILPNIIPHLEDLYQRTPVDPNIVSKKSQLNQIVLQLLSVQTELNDYLLSL